MPGSHHAAADGARLYWEEEGEGPRVLLVHGGTGTSEFDWEFVREPLAERFRLLLTDVRGHGHSSDPHYRLSIGQIGDDVASLLEQVGECDAIIAFSKRRRWSSAATETGSSRSRPHLRLLARCPTASFACCPIVGTSCHETGRPS